MLGAVIMVALPAIASADIFQWTDDAGVAHYTNLKSEVPAAQQGSVQVVVDEAVRRPPATGEAPAQDPPASVAPTSEASAQAQLAEAVYARSQWLSAYLEGLQSGLSAGGVVASGGAVDINGPLVVSGASPWPSAYNYGLPYSYACAWPYSYWCDGRYFYPGVAVFHHPRSRRLGPFRAGHSFGRRPSFGRSWARY
ncbi:MAG TPA: DUF4124 domain-containing protein [Mycobacterium sp.]|nr:DUF4124 domain-containing protein [Mycobacterium sp.]